MYSLKGMHAQIALETPNEKALRRKVRKEKKKAKQLEIQL